ncbi:MAG: exosome complex RNA-binding protein Csl4 [Thermoplasmatota archaeon]
MEELEDKFVVPGDKIGTSEEWLPGEGTYEDGGFVYSSAFGKVEYDEENLEAHVRPVNPISRLEVGSVIYGTIKDRRSSIVTVDINVVEGRSRSVRMDMEGTLHISKVSDDYTDDLKNEYLKNDIIRAKVTQVDPSIQLTTVGKTYGVVSGYCSRCRGHMDVKGSKLYCPRCDIREDRKISKFYGKIKMKKK